MNQRLFLSLYFTFLSFSSFSQNFQSIIKALEEKEFSKARVKLNKILEKDDQHPGALFFYGLYYLDSTNIPLHHLDSAYRFILNATDAYGNSNAKMQASLEKVGINSRQLKMEKEKIEALSFNFTTAENTEESYQSYIDRFPTASEVTIAISKRDSIAYRYATEVDTYEVYAELLAKYPDLAQKNEANARYQQLLYETKTQDNTIQAYQLFIEEHPESPYRELAEDKLFRIYNDANDSLTYLNFTKEYPQNSKVKQAWLSLWYLSDSPEQFLQNFPNITDKSYFQSLQDQFLDSHFFFYSEDKYGIINQKGETVLDPTFQRVNDEYLCSQLTETFIVLEENGKFGAVNLSGETIIPFDYNEVDNFRKSIIKVKNENGYGLFHQSGYQLIACKYEQLEPINQNWVKFQKNGKWGLASYYGTIIIEPLFDEIYAEQNWVVLEEKEQYHLIPQSNLFNEDSNKSYQNAPKYDDYEMSHIGSTIVELDGSYGIINSNGEEYYPIVAEEIREWSEGWIIKLENEYFFIDKKTTPIAPITYNDVIIGKKGLGVKSGNNWGVIGFNGQLVIQPIYDTLFFLGEKGILLQRQDKKFGYFYQTELMDFTKYRTLDIQRVKNDKSNSGTFIITEDKRGKKGLLTENGQTILPNYYKSLQLVGQGFVVAEINNKRGLFDLETGDRVLSPRYDGIASYDEGFLSLLSEQKFGLYDIEYQKIIKPEYEALLKLYGNSDSIFIAKKRGYGLIDKKNEVIVEFEFDELHYWADQVILVKKDNKWRLYDFERQRYLPEEVFDSFEYIKKDDNEIVIATYRSTGYGLLSNRQGRLIVEEHSDIINLGTNQSPFYFVETTVSISGSYYLFYINSKGDIVKEQVVKQEDYEKIVCKY